MHQFKSAAFLFAAVALLSSTVDAHGMLVDPPPRAPASAENNIQKFTSRPPSAAQLNSCFGLAPGPSGRTYQAGSEIEVKWALPIPHGNAPGVRIAIQYNPGEPFESLLEGGDSKALSAKVQLPAGKTSDNAVIQWIWDTAEDNGFYAACGDVTVEAAIGRAGGAQTAAATEEDPVQPANQDNGTAQPVNQDNGTVQPANKVTATAPPATTATPAPTGPKRQGTYKEDCDNDDDE